jgi:hypothetical protein
MIPRRDQFYHDAIQTPRSIQITRMVDFSIVAAGSGRDDFLAAATERITGAFKVVYCKRETSLLTVT